MGVRLGTLARQVDVLDGRFDEQTPVRRITADSRLVGPGDLFVAVRGRHADGHRFLAEAAARGAVAAIVDDPAVRPPLPYLRVTDSRVALAVLAAVQYGHPARELRLVGITGTVGKTSTAVILAHILQAAGIRAGLSGSLQRRPDGTYSHARYTTPGPLELHRRLRQLADAGVQVAVVEATSHALDQKRLHGLRFEAGIFLNLLPEHLDYHGSFSAYGRVKGRFLHHLTPGAPLIFNRADPRVRELVTAPAGHRLISFAAGQETADVTAEQVVLLPGGSRFLLRFPPGAGSGTRAGYPCRLGLLGRHQVVNAAAAAALAWALGVEPERIASALATVPQFYRRLQVHHMDGVTVLDDTAGLPSSIAHAFESLEQLGSGPVVVVYAVRGSRGAEVAAANAAALARCLTRLAGAGVDARLIVTESCDMVAGENHVSDEERHATMEALARWGIPVAWEPALRAAVERAAAAAPPGARVLLLGAQGMNGGAGLLERALARRPVRPGVPLT